MCGRFSLSTPLAVIQGAFPWLVVPDQLADPGVEPGAGSFGMSARFNIAPGQTVAVAADVANSGQARLEHFQWGLVPSWAKDVKIGYKMINARAETVAEKPSFRRAFTRRRCLVLADGFYEWKKHDKGRGKTPHLIRLRGGRPFAMAGLWESWQGDGRAEPLRTCTIITTDANDLLAPIHNRMPVILPEAAHQRWLGIGAHGVSDREDSEALQDLLRPFPESEMEHYPVSTRVNSPANDTPECLEPVTTDESSNDLDPDAPSGPDAASASDSIQGELF